MVFGTIAHGGYHPPFRGIRYYFNERITETTGHPIHVVGTGLSVDDIKLRLSFSTEDAYGRKLATDLHRVLVGLFPLKRVIAFDLSNYERIPEKDGQQLLDSRIQEWVKGAEDRWLSASGERFGDTVRYVGRRPE